MKNISELLSSLNSQITSRSTTTDACIKAIKSICGVLITPSDIVIKGKKIVIGARVSWPIKTAILLKNKEIVSEINKTKGVFFEEIQ